MFNTNTDYINLDVGYLIHALALTVYMRAILLSF